MCLTFFHRFPCTYTVFLWIMCFTYPPPGEWNCLNFQTAQFLITHASNGIFSLGIYSHAFFLDMRTKVILPSTALLFETTLAFSTNEIKLLSYLGPGFRHM